MSESGTIGQCKIHGPGHMGEPCPDQSGENVDEVEEEYGSLYEVFIGDELRGDFEGVKGQLKEMRSLLAEYEPLLERNLDKDLSPDEHELASEAFSECERRIQSAFDNFTMKGKKIDLRKIAGEKSFKETYNDVIFEVNDYIDKHMKESGEQLLEEI